MNGESVAHPPVGKNLFAPLTAFAPVTHDVIGENRRELFAGKRILTSHALQTNDEDSCILRHLKSRLIRDPLRGLAHDLGIQGPARKYRDRLQFARLLLIQKVCLMFLEFSE